MLFRKTNLADIRLIEVEPIVDERGFFARTFCTREYDAEGLQSSFVQHSVSFTARAGSVRGMHFARHPHEEVKIVRCLAGAIHDVVIDLRPGSPTYRKWEAYELTPDNRLQLYVPTGFAHGFQTLAPNCAVSYLISAFYVPDAASGVRHDDPAFKIAWPLLVADMSPRDRTWPDFRHYAASSPSQ